MIAAGSTVRIVGILCHNWPDPEDRCNESEIMRRYLGMIGVVARTDNVRYVPYTVSFKNPPIWDDEAEQPNTMPSEMRFRGFELQEI